jgi:hypothetical protein
MFTTNIVSNVFELNTCQVEYLSDKDLTLMTKPKVSLEELFIKFLKEQETNSRPRPIPPKPKTSAPQNILWFEASLKRVD